MILVPGSLNHLIPGTLHLDISTGEVEEFPYFSGNIVQTVESLGYDVYVIQALSALGSMEENGDEVVAETRAWYQSHYPQGGVPITMLGHSAGGFYALYAASRLQDLPLQSLITVSTPYSGADLANLSSHVIDMTAVSQQIYDSSFGSIDLRGLAELTSAQTTAFLGNLSLDPGLSIRAYGCSQKAFPVPPMMMDAKYLWPGFYGTSAAIKGPADGIVGIDTVYGEGIALPTSSSDTPALQVQAVRDETCNLDHAEQVLDYRYFALLGQTDLSYIVAEQARFYTAILSQ